MAVEPAGPALASQLRLPEGQGLVVTLVEPDSPAARAGLKRHDVLTKIDDQILIDPRQLAVLVRNHHDGEAVAISYVRAGAEARASATLATHVPPPRPDFQWMGGDGPNVFFRTERFGSGGADSLPAPAGMPAPMLAPLSPGARVKGHAVGPGEDRVMIYRPQANFVYSDDAGEMVVRASEKGRVLTAKNRKGDVIFQGPIDTPEQRAALPEDVRKRLDKFDGLDVFDTAVAPPALPGEASLPPGEPRAAAAPVL